MQSVQKNSEKILKTLTKDNVRKSKLNDHRKKSSDSTSDNVKLSAERNTSVTYKKARKRKRKRPISSSEDDLEGEEAYIDKALEEKLKECAKRNNLSSLEIKKILKSVVGNDHVLAMVKLQEEEELEREKQKQQYLTPKKSSSTSKVVSSGETSNLKLTRAKARALNKKPIPIPPLNKKEPEPEVAALICQELNSDEEDEEYCPREEDYVSDDDQTTTNSDIDSQPRTPVTPLQHYHDVMVGTPLRYTEDGLFKVPRERYDSFGSNHEGIIAKRTRSKLCLETTPIEAIESNFIPPDITTDMYDFDGELDQEWVEFLNEFSKPLNTTNNTEEDDEADPEYVAADKIPLDAEELREVNISKKELSDLISELFDGLVKDGVVLDENSTLETPKRNTPTTDQSPERSPQRKKQKISICAETSSQKEDSQQQQQQKEQQNVQFTATVDETLNTKSSSADISVKNEMYFNPNVVSTPQQNCGAQKLEASYNATQNSETVLIPTAESEAEVSFNNQTSTQPSFPTISVPTQQFQQQQEQSSSIVVTQAYLSSNNQTTYITVPFPENLPSNGLTPKYLSIPVNLLEQCASIPNQNCQIVNKIDLTRSNNSQKDRIIAAKPTTSHPEPNLPQSSATLRKSLATDETNSNRKKSKRLRLHQDLRDLYAKKYEELKNLDLNTDDEYKFDENQIGFTEYQRQILDQQMRIHVQFCVQNFIQTYSHPELWKFAQPEKEMLLELNEKCNNENSVFNACNLKPALNLIKLWEDELSVCSEENRALMDFFYNEIDRIKNSSRHCTNYMKFPPRIMKLIVESSVFMYPDLLPKIPFRFNVNKLKHNEFCPSEDHIIAHLMDNYFKEFEKEKIIEENTIGNNYTTRKLAMSRNSRRCTLRKVCESISENLITWKSWGTIYSYIKFCRSKKIAYNPIKFYFERGRSPPFKHVLHQIDLHNILPPKYRLSELPPVWKEFVTMLNTTGLVENSNHSIRRSSTNTKSTNKIVKSSSVSYSDQSLAKFVISHENISQNNLGSSQILAQAFDLQQEQQHQQQQQINDNANGQQVKNVVINFNYIFDSSISTNPEQLSEIINNPNTSNLFENSVIRTNYINLSQIQQQSTAENKEKENSKKSSDVDFIDDENISSSTLQPFGLLKGQKLLTDYFRSTNPKESQTENCAVKEEPNKTPSSFSSSSSFSTISEGDSSNLQNENNLKKTFHERGNKSSGNYKKYRLSSSIKKFQRRKVLQRQFKALVNLSIIKTKYSSKKLQRVYTYFRALELYTDLLERLKMYCKKMKTYSNTVTTNNSLVTTTVTTTNSNITTALTPNTSSGTSATVTPTAVSTSSSNMEETSSVGGNSGIATGIKRPRINDDESKIKKSTIKANENYKQMLMSESNEDINKKDAIFAFNFYERVEEIFKEKNDNESFNKFQNILMKFDPKQDRVADLYNKIEEIFLPDHEDLLEIFLTFLLPSQAIEIGKFFEYFMSTNMQNFINKLNIYFNKQPSQIKKVYTSLNELSEENDLTMEKIKSKILPLLKGNQFLTDWFLQMFPSEEPPKSLGTICESMNAKQLETQSIGFAPEFLPQKDLVSDSLEHQPCQIRYINGRIFYGSRVLLPAKLAFMAKDFSKNEDSQQQQSTSNHSDSDDNNDVGSNYEIDSDDDDDEEDYCDDERLSGKSTSHCVHHIRKYAEKIIRCSSQGDKDSCTEGEKSEDEDAREIEIKYEICDDVAHRKHAVRLNPSLYSPASYLSQMKFRCDIGEREMNRSPKKQCLKPIVMTSIPLTTIAAMPSTVATIEGGTTGFSTTTTTTNSSSLLSPSSSAVPTSIVISKEKRKSPTKKTLTKSPGPSKKPACNQIASSDPTMITSAAANALKAAKRMRAMIEEDSNGSSSDDQNKSVQQQQQLKKKIVIKTSPVSSPARDTLSSFVLDSECSENSKSSSILDMKPSPSSLIMPAQTSTTTTPTISWTREEDKIILEEVKLGCGSESLLNRLKLKLPQRNIDEIIQRHQFLMDVLSQLQNRT